MSRDLTELTKAIDAAVAEFERDSRRHPERYNRRQDDIPAGYRRAQVWLAHLRSFVHRMEQLK